MDWCNTKNVLILLLLLANLIVGGLYIGLMDEKLYISEGAVADATESLEAHGITVVTDGINRKKQRMPVYVVQLCDDEEIKTRLAKASEAFGIFFDEIVVIDVPGGFSVSKSPEQGTEELRKAVYSASYTGDMNFEASIGEAAPEENAEGILESLRKLLRTSENVCLNPEIAPESAELSAVKKFYNALYVPSNYSGTSAKMSFKCYDVSNLGRGRAISCVASADGIVIPELKSIFWFDESGSLKYALGRFPAGKAEKSYSATLLDGIDIIYKMELSEVSVINSQYDVFSVVPMKDNRFYLVPSIMVSFEDKNGNAVNNIYDSIVGANKKF